MGEKGVGKLSRETPPPREGEPMGATERQTQTDTDSDREREREREGGGVVISTGSL